MKKGRKGVYETKIQPKFQDIKKYLEEGLSERQIAYNLGIAYSTFNKYKKEKTEFSELLCNSRASPVKELENALFRRAIGCEYKERRKKVIDGKVTEEIIIKESLPEVSAIKYLLQNWGDYTSDPQILSIKEREIKLKEEKLKEEQW